MLTFEPYSFDALKRARPYISQCPYLCNDLSTGTLLMWQEGTNVQFCIWHGTFVIRQDVGDQPAFSWPYGADPDGMIDELMIYVRENNLPLRFFAVDAETLEVIHEDKRFISVNAATDSRWSDYIYSFESAATFQGKKFSGQRNHVNKFRRLYGEPIVRNLDAEIRPRVHEFLNRYVAEHPDAKALERIELERTRLLLDRFDELGLYAAYLTVGDEIAAFSIGEIIGDMLIIHVEKALTRYEGVYPTMYQSFVRFVGENTDQPMRLVNREDDSGDPGLRTSKQQYHPIGMVDKYLVHVDSPAAYIKPLPVLTASGVVLTEIRRGDRPAYYRLNTDVENNRLWGYDYRDDPNITGPIDEDTFYDSVHYDMRVGDSINFAIRLSEDGDMIGEAVLYRFTSGGFAEAGCRIIPEHHGHGYGKAAYGALVAFAENQLGLKVVARCFHENLPSYRMITDTGFHVVSKDEQFFYFERQKGVTGDEVLSCRPGVRPNVKNASA